MKNEVQEQDGDDDASVLSDKRFSQDPASGGATLQKDD